jgi:hypothetical protein
MISRKKVFILFLAVVMAFGSLISVNAATSSPSKGSTVSTKVTNVKKKKVRKKGKKLKITWKKKSGVKVSITLLKKKNGKWKKVKSYTVAGSKGKKTTSNLSAGKYRWKIYTYKTVSGKKYKSKTYTSKTTKTIK